MKNKKWVAVVAGSAALLWIMYLLVGNRSSLPDGLIQATGRVEGDQVRVSTRLPGRVVSLARSEGDTVKEGDVLATLADIATESRQARAKAAVETANARVGEAKARLAAAKSRATALQIAIGIMQKELPVEIASAKAAVDAAEASIRSASGVEALQKSDVERNQKLRENNATSQADLDSSLRMLMLVQDYVNRCIKDKVKSESDVLLREFGQDRIRAKEAELAALSDAVGEAEAAHSAAVAALGEVEAAIVAANADVKDLSIVAPVSGVVTARMVNPGELVAATQPLFEIVDLQSLYLKVFLGGPDMGRIAVGSEARLYTDAFPEQPVAATVRAIASVAEFTPKDVATPDERVKLVYAVKIYLTENPEQRMKSGMPADAVIRWKDGAEWVKPTW